MSQWSDFYKNRVGDGYSTYCKKRYKLFINAILENSRDNIREEGCGIATISKIIMQNIKINISMFDIDSEQVELSKENTCSNLPYVGDIFEKHGNTDVIFSHGVLEHFSDNNIKKIIARQKQEARLLIHYVPTDLYVTPSFGDERLMSVETWIKQFNPIDHFTFNDGKDLVLFF